MRIHPVISIAHLEPAPAGQDPYKRDRHANQAPIQNEDHRLEDDDLFVERFLDKKISRGKIEYLVKWQDSGPQHNACPPRLPGRDHWPIHLHNHFINQQHCSSDTFYILFSDH